MPSNADAGCACALHVACVPEPWWHCVRCGKARSHEALSAISGARFELASGFGKLLWACANAHCRRDARAALLALRAWRRAFGPAHATTIVLAATVAGLFARRGKFRLAEHVSSRARLASELPVALGLLAERGDFGFLRTPTEHQCFLCWSPGDLVEAGCACRGASALAHVACHGLRAAHAAALAGLDYVPWTTCSTCRQDFTGHVRMALAGRWCKAEAASPLPLRLCAATNLARCLEQSGRLDEALQLHRETLAVCRDARGAGHADTLACEMALGTALHSRGLYAEAHAAQARVYALVGARFGPDDAQTLTCAQNLALSLSSLGRFEEAEALTRETLRRLAAQCGDEHYATLMLRSNLALCLADQSKFEEAEGVAHAVLASRRRLLGPEHPETLVAAGNLAMVLSSRGRHAEAEALQRELAREQRRVLGEDHPSTLCNLVNLGTSLLELGQYDAAETIVRGALEAERRVLGHEHPSVFTTEQQLLRLLCLSGRHDEAEAGIARLLEAQVRVLGDAHPSTMMLRTLRIANDARGEPCFICLEALPAPAQMGCACRGAAGLAHAGCLARNAVARGEMESWVRCGTCKQRYTGNMEIVLATTLRARAERLGGLDGRFQAEAWYAEALMHRGDFDEAERVLRALCDEQARLGSPRAFATAIDVAAALYGKREYQRAADIYRRALAKRPEDVSIRGNLASALMHLGPEAVAEGEAMHRGVLEEVRARRGPEHPETLAAGNNLAHALDYGGKRAEAREMLEGVLQAQRRVLGPDHPETLGTEGSMLVFSGTKEGLAEHRDRCERALGPRHATSALARENARNAEMMADLPPGTVVRLHGLTRAELNGRRGRVAGLAAPDRYAVVLRNCAAPIALRRANLAAVGE
jgi:tetratricopeptide (TPR) repeat protein